MVLLLAVAVSATAISSRPAFVLAADLDLHRINQRLFAAAADKIAPCVVRIETVGGSQPLAVEAPTTQGTRKFRAGPGSSFLLADGPTTGLIYSSDGYILTSSFNFVREPALIQVVLPDGRRFVAECVGRDQVRKLALLKIDAHDLPMPDWIERPELRVGQWAIALGRAYQDESPSVSVGIVSALNRMDGYALQVDAKLSPANYGGPVVDLEGRVMGMAVPMSSTPGELAGVEFYDSGIGFMLPHEQIEELVKALKQGHSFYRGFLGVQVDARSTGGARITFVADPSPAKDAGLQEGDLIVEAAGKEIKNYPNLLHALNMKAAGDNVRLSVLRDDVGFGVELVLKRDIELGDLPAQEPPADIPQPPPDTEEDG